MSFLDEVRKDREPLAHVLKKHRGIRKIVEDLYPDRAHFIYELLQNAEDAGATQARFVLCQDSVSFEHNGRPFTEKDVWGITDIGEGTKAGDEDKIGRFGVGFKAVFAYCETPHIYSPTFSFKISELVLPTELTPNSGLGKNTCFQFPFNNPKKPAPAAYEEIKVGLEGLVETTLLFLSHLESIRWKIGQQPAGEVLRIKHSEHHIEVLKQSGGKPTTSSHFLQFTNPVTGLQKQYVAVAYELDFLPNIAAFDANKPLDKQLKINPANPGRVAVFFPAEKETSGLRFHLHAPFVPELSRASIKETPANGPLFKQLERLAASSLHTVRDLKLLTSDFLAVLPNQQDDIRERYLPIRDAIIVEMNDKPLTPTHSKSYAPAKTLLQAKASLKELLSEKDIEFLVDYNEDPPQWAIGASQKNSNMDRFLSGLAITEWDTQQFVELLCNKTGTNPYSFLPPKNVSPDEVMAWLSSKPEEWHQRMYSLIREDFLVGPDYKRRRSIERLKPLRIVRLNDGTYSVGRKCYFPGDEVESDEILPRVAKGVYSSGKSKAEQDEARKFLEELGVRIVGEVEQIEVILTTRYTYEAEVPDEDVYRRDLERFITLVEKEPVHAELFADAYIFHRACDDWSKPGDVFLDSPYLDTGLSAYYYVLGENAKKAALAQSYQNCGIPVEKIAKFAQAVGAQAKLEIQLTSCYSNPDVDRLVWAAPGGWSARYGINEDWTIEGAEELLARNDEALSRLVWKTACDKKDDDWLTAKFRNNSQNQVREAASQLVCILRDAAWIPQTDGRFVRPPEASRELLPRGFAFDKGYEWLKAIRFGEEVENRSEEYREKQVTAERLGFTDADTFERAKQFAALPKGEQERILADAQRRQPAELPDHEPRNPERREAHVGGQATEAPERLTEVRTRTVSVGVAETKQQAEQYLRQQYTNPNGEMFCQMCRTPMPFTLDDGNYYFEKVEFLPELKKRHYQNYLALCPNHAAMFLYANGSRDRMKDIFVELTGNELQIVLAQKHFMIYFTKTHIADLKRVIEIDQREAELAPSDTIDGDA
ncbi:hypothetical protein SCL_1076 [Sulfuricaulis limicola]|uniref:Sacsin/Nov domain-containing protein n=1 Tax=Sulfuricaulis limicola TaxID=1620215 RepID=A0A1B4XF14_9GAMM|nr:hypothetical protein [Sulfuricaulis limicola]BAV33390.1 hypothetical protein SCL_1076 [Sulfuricaulis limicola]